MTLIIAPFGYGKTTIGLQMADSSETPVAWLTCDPAINALEPFLAHLLRAIADAAPVSAEAAETAASLDRGDSAGGAIADVLIEARQPLRIILDEAHRLTDPNCVQVITDLAVHAPAGVTMVLLGRSTPSLPVSSLRLKGLLAELGPDDLALRPSEAIALARAMDARIDDHYVESIRASTSGWIGGFRLALLESRQGDGQAPADRGVSLPGLETLGDDILADFDEVYRPFIACLSLLEEISPAMAEAVAEPGIDSTTVRRVLSTMSNLGYLLDAPSMSDRARVLHPAIKAALRRRCLESTTPAQRLAISQRAFRVHERAGQEREAIRVALAAGMAEEACDILEQSIPQLLSREDWRAVDDMLALVPGEIRAQRPRLLLSTAWVSHLSGRSEPIREIERQARAIYTVDPERFRDEAAVRAEFNLLNLANNVQIERDPADSLSAIRSSREAIPLHQRFPYGLAHCLEGWALGTSGRLPEASELMNRAAAHESEMVDACSLRPLIGLIFAYRTSGAISECERTAEDVLALATTHRLPVSAGWAAMFSGIMAYERNDLRTAEQRLARVEQSGRLVHLLSLRESMFCLAMTRLALGQRDEALATVRRLRELVLDRHAAGIIPGIRSFEARLALQMGDMDRARSWLGSSRRTSPEVPMLAFEHEPLTRAKALLAVGGAGSIAEARRMVNMMRARAERASQRSTLIEVMAVSALVSKADRREAAALADLASAFELAAGDWYTRTFLDLGQQLAPLLRKLEGQARPEADRILALLERREASSPEPALAPAPGRPDASGRESILTVLTIREAEVMERLARRLTNAEIAEELSISLQTVKSHAANIYGKLGVSSRREAIVAAEAYDLGSVERSRRDPRTAGPQNDDFAK